MPGIRIQHPTERNVTFTLADGSRPYREPWTCPPPPAGCASTHLVKTYHLRLDETGSAIVSHEIVDRLRRIPGQPFVIANEVAEPPKQVVHVTRLVLQTHVPAPGATR